MGTAPTHGQENRGLDDKQINLGVVQPGERPAIFSDALRRLSNQAKFMHSDMGRYWYSMSASLNRVAADRAGQLEEALVLLEIDKSLLDYINSLTDQGHFDTIQTAPSSSAEVPDESGGVRAIVLGVGHPHTGRDGSAAMQEARDILLQRGSTPRVYRNMLVFFAVESRQLDNVKDAMRSALAWSEIVRDTKRLNLTQSDEALAKAKLQDAGDTLKTRVREAWCYLLYPHQESAQTDVEWTSTKIPAQDGLFSRASKKLVSEQGIWPEIGPDNLNRQLEKYEWNDNDHLALKGIWEYLNRYIYLPRVKNREALIKSIQASVAGVVPGPFAYAERWDDASQTYAGLAIDGAMGAAVVIDDESVIVRPYVAEKHRKDQAQSGEQPGVSEPQIPSGPGEKGEPKPGDEPKPQRLPTRFQGTVLISADRPARDMHQIVEGIVQQLTTIPGASLEIKLEIDAEVPGGIDRSKERTLIENANTLGFIDKLVD